MLITHDRYFLDTVCNTIIELHNGKLFKHSGSYGSYLENKEEPLFSDSEEEDIKVIKKEKINKLEIN
mgnify:CR=1 FL=1